MKCINQAGSKQKEKNKARKNNPKKGKIWVKIREKWWSKTQVMKIKTKEAEKQG